jgi:hypothetical protein
MSNERDRGGVSYGRGGVSYDIVEIIPALVL